MIDSLTRNLDWMHHRISDLQPVDKVGSVIKVTGLIIESEGPEVSIGDICEIHSPRRSGSVAAEVVGFRDNRVLLMPMDELHAIHPGCLAVASARAASVPVGDSLIGRVIDGLGRPIDDLGRLNATNIEGLNGTVPNPMRRQRITEPFQTGIRAIDLFTAMGKGQRMGIFSGSGVGKSILLGMIARGSQADVNVIALVGERGRELREFIENDLGPEGMAKSVVIVSTSDQPPPLRLRAALLATIIAEHFRAANRDVLFIMDSLTRFAMAQREIGLAIGEPPTSRGYTPSVFSMLARLVERTGMGETGSITALYTVLVEGDDLSEPVADAVRSFLDGHIILSRALANANQYPPIDIMESVSRLDRAICTKEEIEQVAKARELFAIYGQNEDLVNIGAYAKGSNSSIDLAIDKCPQIRKFLRQMPDELSSRSDNYKQLKEILD